MEGARLRRIGGGCGRPAWAGYVDSWGRPRVAVSSLARYAVWMSTLTAYINPACSRCRRLVELLTERGVQATLVEYLKTPPDRATLEKIVTMPGIVAPELVRRDQRFAELGLTDAACSTTEQVVDLLLAHPELLERPLVVLADRAIVARPPERVLELLG